MARFVQLQHVHGNAVWINADKVYLVFEAARSQDQQPTTTLQVDSDMGKLVHVNGDASQIVAKLNAS